MGTFLEKIIINAPKTAVWEALADIGNIAAWNPGVVASHTTSQTQPEGIGATRYCDLGGKNFLDEQVVKWEPEQALTMRVTDTNLPFQSVDIRFYLEGDEGETAVTVSPIYELKYGPVGKLLDVLYVKNSYQKGMATLLSGLKSYVEKKHT